MKRILCLCLVLVLCLSLAACGGSKSAPVVGTWCNSTSVNDGYTMVLKKDGTGVIKYGNTVTDEFTWAYSSTTNVLTLISELGDLGTATYNAANDTILLSGYYTLIRK